MILEQEQTHRSMEPNRDPRHIPKLIWSINLCQKRQEHTIGKIQPPSINGVEKTVQPQAKESC